MGLKADRFRIAFDQVSRPFLEGQDPKPGAFQIFLGLDVWSGNDLMGQLFRITRHHAQRPMVVGINHHGLWGRDGNVYLALSQSLGDAFSIVKNGNFYQ